MRKLSSPRPLMTPKLVATVWRNSSSLRRPKTNSIFAPPGAFPREADRALCNFLHVPLRPNPKISDFERLDGGRTLDPRCLYSVSGLFRGYIGRFVKKSSRRGRNFALAREFLWLHSLKCQIRRKSRYMESKMEISEKLPPQLL